METSFAFAMATRPLIPILLKHRRCAGINKKIGSRPDAQKTDFEGIIQPMEN